MIELHGWVTIRETYKADFDKEENIDLLVKKIQDNIKKLSWFKPEIKAQNGEYFIELSLYTNRMNPQTTNFRSIGTISKYWKNC